MDVDKLKEKFWGEWRFDVKAKKFTTNELSEEGKPMKRTFCEFILDPIQRVINMCLTDEIDKVKKFLETMNVELSPEQWDLREKKLCKVVLHKWLDSADSLMDTIAVHLPSPKVSQRYRTPLL